MKKGLLMTLIIVLIISVVPFSLSAKEITIKLAHLNAQQPFDIPSAAMAAAFKSAVEANSNGEIKVDIFASGVLGKERETMIQVKSGVVQSYISSVGGMSTFYPMINITNMPFVFSSYNVGYKVYDGPFGQELAADIERKAGFHVLGFGESGGFFAITNSKREIRTPRDMRGVKIRTMSMPLHQAIINSLGGAATPISWSEVYTSLQTGVIDGQMNPVSIINMAKFYEVQKFATLTNHIYAPYVWVMNPRFYNGLSAAHKAIIDDAARTAVLAGRGLSRIIDSSEKGLPVLMSKMKVYVPTPAEMQQFKDLSIPAATEFLEKEYGREGKEWIDKFLKAIADAERELGY